MRIIVLQRFAHTLDRIRRHATTFNCERAKQITFTQDPYAALEQTRGNEPVLVISGEIFDDLNMRGSQLAFMMKKQNPRVIFFIYSLTPNRNDYTDGLIPKWPQTSDLAVAKIITSDLKAATAASIKAAFPQIQ